MFALSCAVVGTSGANVISVGVPSGSLVKEVANLVKRHSPREFRDVSAAKIKLYMALEQGEFIPRSSFELGLLPEVLEAGEYNFARDFILEAWVELDEPDEVLESVLPPRSAHQQAGIVQVVALIPSRRVRLIFGHEVCRISVNASALVGELKDEVKNRTSEMIKLVEAKLGDRRLHRDDVRARRSPQVMDFLRAIAARDEIDLSRTVVSVFGDGDRDIIDALVVPSEMMVDPCPPSPTREGSSTQKMKQRHGYL
ncbi:hypothetical protein KRP22_014866 [Phytophthora ramorum]|uniref:uncharacterized protein n=1 Tax=Phytophthora ramorum TaxID=164328 RepID=UPI0030A964D5|nr:hypothetical protein KRP23_11840 [Phytophthora ramorum]KAH7496185.1 hypothetical protein KRP22_14079 [Phytophthora ramorum]